jgi:CRP-like cAMP-binding protein
MLARFEGKDGRQRLVELFAKQKFVQHNNAIANRLAETSKLEELQKGKRLYTEGEPGKHALYFVLSGSLDLSVQDKARCYSAGWRSRR